MMSAARRIASSARTRQEGDVRRRVHYPPRHGARVEYVEELEEGDGGQQPRALRVVVVRV